MIKKVLIIDDDENNVKYLSTVLEENGYAPLGAPDGEAGLKTARAEKPALIVLDVMMPRKPGFQTLSALKKDASLKDTPVIMLTSVRDVIERSRKGESIHPAFDEIRDVMLDKMQALVDKHAETGGTRPELFLDKPIEPDDFLKAVASLIGKS